MAPTKSTRCLHVTLHNEECFSPPCIFHLCGTQKGHTREHFTKTANQPKQTYKKQTHKNKHTKNTDLSIAIWTTGAPYFD
jgi:hypothetical protein